MLTIVLLDVRRLEILRVLNVVEDSAEGFEAIGVVCKLLSASCVDDVPCIHYRVGYLFPVVPAVVVVAIWLRPRGFVCRWLATPGSMDACDFLILLVFLILLLQLLLTMMASRSTTCLRYDCCGGPRPGAMKQRQLVLSLELFNNIFGEVYDTFHLQVLRHLHESQGCFCHRGDWSSEDWIVTLLNSLLRLRGGRRAHSAARTLRSPLC